MGGQIMLYGAMAKAAIMIQGTGSDVGKSLLVAGLARLFARQGLAVRPFKPQNMSNNAAITQEGFEIGRAQALQARAARVAPSVHMNPVLLKPETDRGAQLIVQGMRQGSLTARAYAQKKRDLLACVLESFHKMEQEADLVLVEGAGSPAEINLRPDDIANMGFAAAADLPVVLVGDIDRGGVIAALCGTQLLLPKADRARIKGFVINRFRGDVSLFEAGLKRIEAETAWPSLGVVPWFADAARLPAEDAQSLTGQPAPAGPEPERTGSIRIAVPQLSRIANFDDLDPLRLEPHVSLIMVPPGQPIPLADLILLPGTKSTLGDLAFVRQQGWDIDILAHWRRGGRVLGICGGYQMLGQVVRDPCGLEGPASEAPGLGLLEVTTTLGPQKRLETVSGRHVATGLACHGYEIHLGQTTGPDCARPVFSLATGPDGATSPDGRVAGSYVHGLFADDRFRQAFLAELGARHSSGLAYEATIDATLEALADHLARHLDSTRLYDMARSRQATTNSAANSAA